LLPETAFPAGSQAAIASRELYDRGKALWIKQSQAHPDDARVWANAERYFEPTDVALAAEYLKRAHQIDPRTPEYSTRLGDLYVRTLFARDLQMPDGRVMRDPFLADKDFVDHVRSDIESSDDLTMQLHVARSIANFPRTDANSPLNWVMAERILKKGESLDSSNRQWAETYNVLRETEAGRPPQQMQANGTQQIAQPGQIRVGGNVQSAKLVQQAQPQYPALAKQARIQGTVRFNVVIGKDGTMKNMQLVSGHPLLVQPAQEAVRQWVYQPTTLNGNPVEVVTTIDVNFTLSDGPAATQ
jgi:TonB family protein